MSYFVDSASLQAILKDVRVIDVRGSSAYGEGHIPGAVCLDMKRDFTGGTGFFPEVGRLAKTLGENGISVDTPVVIYDGGSHRDAAKAWVVLHYLGHDRLQVLQGGFAAWVGADYPVSAVSEAVSPCVYVPNVRVEVLVELDEMKEKLAHDHSVLIDSRAKERFTGEHEPKYEQVGHIPGAVNYAAKDVFAADGTFRNKADLAGHFARVHDGKEVVVSCGTGTSACMNFVALKEAGVDDVKLFPGGFKQWIDEGNDVETGE